MLRNIPLRGIDPHITYFAYLGAASKRYVRIALLKEKILGEKSGLNHLLKHKFSGKFLILLRTCVRQ